jgi:hypothetical protein
MRGPRPTTHNPQPTTHNPQPTTHNQIYVKTTIKKYPNSLGHERVAIHVWK